MSWTRSFFSPTGDLHQVTRTGALLNDLTTGQSGLVISDDDGSAIVSDSRGQLHQIIKNGSMSTDLTTGRTYLEF